MYADRTVLNPVMGELERIWFKRYAIRVLNSVFYFLMHCCRCRRGSSGTKSVRKSAGAWVYSIWRFTAVTGWVKAGICCCLPAWSPAQARDILWPAVRIVFRADPEKFRSLGSAIINSGMAFGIALGLMTSSWLVYDRVTRRMPFYAMAIPSVLVGVAIWLFVKEKTHRRRRGQAGTKGKFSDLLKNRNLILTYIMVFCSLFGFFVILTGFLIICKTSAVLPVAKLGLFRRWSRGSLFPARCCSRGCRIN